MPPIARTLALTFALATSATAQKPPTTTPPMGWNSWDAYGLTVTEPDFRANVAVLHDQLLPFGWRYAVIDEGWFFENPKDRETPGKLHYALDSHGRYVPTPLRFPSAGSTPSQSPQPADAKLAATIEETTFAPLSKWVHAQGLLFGIHIVRGIPRASVERNLPIDAPGNFRAQDAADQTDACGWDPTNWGIKDNAAGQAWYDSLLTQYAAWGVDLLKVDCISDHPYKADEIRMIRRAIDKTGRPMVLSLSPGPTAPEHAAEVAELSTMWRISNDVWDLWAPAANAKKYDGFPQNILGQFDRAAQWDHFKFSNGHWPDLDMLPLGELRPSPGWREPRHTRLTPDEQQTLLTLWATSRSPLILGANLTLLDDATLKLLTNRSMLEVDQTATSTTELLRKGDLAIRRAELRAKGHPRFAIALFNLGDQPMAVDDALTGLHPFLKPGDNLALVDVWTSKQIGKLTQIPAHGSILLMVK